MKFYVAKAISYFADKWPRRDLDHAFLFHGKEFPGERWDFRVPGDSAAPLDLARSGHWKPAICMPGNNFVVNERLAGQLSILPNVELRPVRIAKLIDVPYCPPGDISYRESPVWRKAVVRRGIEQRDKLYERAPDVLALHEGYPAYFELVAYPFGSLLDKYKTKDVPVDLPISVGGSDDFPVSVELLQNHPVVGFGGHVLSEIAFRLIEPFLDRDFFEIGEGEI